MTPGRGWRYSYFMKNKTLLSVKTALLAAGRSWSAWWRQYQWCIIGGLSILTLLLGTWGFRQCLPAPESSRPWPDCLYLSLQLFILESGMPDCAFDWTLQLARFLAPLLLGYTTVRAVWALLQEQVSLWCLRRWQKHAVVCGLGVKGRRLTQELRQRGHRVVVLEADETNGNIPLCRALGAVVLVGDAANPALLAQARVAQARHLFAVTGCDSVNVEIAVQSRQLQSAAGAMSPADDWCLVHLQETRLRELLGQQQCLTVCQGPCRPRFFNTFDNAARLVFRSFPPDVYARRRGSHQVHLVIIGFGRMGESLALQAARLGHYAWGHPVHLTVLDEAADQKVNLFLRRYPRFREICRLSWFTLRLEDPAVFPCHFLSGDSGLTAPTLVYVCLEDEQLGFLVAMHLRQCCPAPPWPILVRVRSLTGLASLLPAEPTGAYPAGGIHPFGSSSETCNLDLILHGTLDTLAQAYHASYVRLRSSRGEQDESMVSWEELPEDLKDSNRWAAEHFWVKVRALEDLGYQVRDKESGEVRESLCTLGPEVELLARMEHSRWNAERWLAGWRLSDPGAGKDVQQKLSPYLIPYDALPENIKDYDRQAAHIVPLLLDRLGKVLVRPGDPGED